MQLKKILIIRLSSIGDVVVTSPIVRCVKLQLGAEVHFLIKKNFRSVVDANPYIDTIWEYEDEQLLSLLKAEAFDLVIDLHKNNRTVRLTWALGVKTMRYDKLNVQKFLLTQFGINRLPANKHLVDRYFESLNVIGVNNDGEGLDQFIHSQDRVVLDQFKISTPYYVLVLGSAHNTKMIPVIKCKEIIQNLDLHCVLLGGPKEKELGEDLHESLLNRTINLCGKLSLGQSASIIDQSNFVIAPDTGMMHMAAALKKPVVSVWGNTDPILGMYPYYGDHDVPELRLLVEGLTCRPCSKLGYEKCPKGHFKCMMDQDVSKIMLFKSTLA